MWSAAHRKVVSCVIGEDSEIVAVCRPEAGLCRWLAYFTPARREMLQFRYLRNINSRFTQWVRVGSVGKFQFLPEAQRF